MHSFLLNTYDNSSLQLVLTDEQKEALLPIAGKKIKDIVHSDNSSVLVFPYDFNYYGDDIDISTVFDIEGDKLQTGNIMGFIGCNGHMLKIGSRFDKGRKDNFMHYMLEKVLSINLFDLNHDTDDEEIFDFLPFLFPVFLKNAMSQGLYKEYKTFKRNDAQMKGVLDVSRHIRLNIPSTGNIAYNTREHTHDNTLTELIRHTLEHIKTKEFGEGILNCDNDTKACVSLIRQATSCYNRNDRSKVIADNLRSKIHPYYSEYEPLRKLCLQILRNDEIKYGEKDDAVNGVLFDGAWLWEEYLNTFINSCGLRHPRNKKREGGIPLFADGTGHLYPDFYGKGIILDAKYKGYGDKSLPKIGSDDLHQVVAYMYMQKSRTGIFMFPNENKKTVCDSKTLNGYGGMLHLIGLPISKELGYREFGAEMSLREHELQQQLSLFISGQ